MAKNLDPKCKRCRREGEKLFLKGERCYTPKCSMIRRNYFPGVHGPAGIVGKSEYYLQLREKQKAKKIYGLLEKQFRNYFLKASKKKGITDEILMQLLERRLDNVVFRLGFAKSRMQARQLINHKHFLVNDKIVNIPSYQVKQKDKIKLKKSSIKKPYFSNIIKSLTSETVPKWLKLDTKNLCGEVIDLPTLADIDRRINTRLIVEYYSR